VKRVVCSEKRSQTAASIVGLGPTFRGEFYSVVWYSLVDIAVLCVHVSTVGRHVRKGEIGKGILFPSDCAWRINMIIRGFPILMEVYST